MVEISYDGYTTQFGTLLMLRQPYNDLLSPPIHAALMNDLVLRRTKPKDVNNGF